MISEMPCSASSVNATGISSRTGQRISPPGSDEYSLMWNELTSDGQLYQAMMTTAGSSMNSAAEDVDPRLAARRQPAVDDVDAHVLVALQRVRRRSAGRPRS